MIFLDLIVFNAKVITLDSESHIQEAIGVAGGYIAVVGSDSYVLEHRCASTQCINARGCAVIPGLTDCHAHMDREGLKMGLVSLSQVRSIEDLKDVIAKTAMTRPAGAWIVTSPLGEPPFYGGNVASFLRDGRVPNRHDLDEAAPTNPVYIRAPWGYWRPKSDASPLVSIANTEALKRSGVYKATREATASIVIERDREGEPTGVFRESGPVLLVEILLMSPECWFSEGDREKGLEMSMNAYASVGTTSVFEGHGVSPEVIQAYGKIRDRGGMTVRSHLVVGPSWGAGHTGSVRDALQDWYVWAAGRGLGDERLRIAGLFGSVNRSESEVLLSAYKPYTGWAGYTYDSAMPPKLFREFVLEAARLGFRVATLFPNVIDVFEEANRITPIGELRWVFGHIGTLTRRQIDRIKDLGAVITLHTNRTIADTGATLAWEYGQKRVNEIVPTRSLIDAGVKFGIASDNNPISLFEPIWHCVARREPKSGQRIAPEQALSREEALRVAIQGGAWVTFEEKQRGLIEAGRFADFVMLSDDPLRCEEDQLPDIQALVTVIGGGVVSDRR